MHSLISPWSRYEKAVWYETFRNFAYLAKNSNQCKLLLICHSAIASSSKSNSIRDKHFTECNAVNFTTRGKEI